MRYLQGSRVQAISSYIRATYSFHAAVQYEIGEGVVHTPPVLAFGYKVNELIRLGGGYMELQVIAEVEEGVTAVMQAGEPQKVLDEMRCEGQMERKVWAVYTRLIRESVGKRAVKLSRG
jgi:hypothetical protein